MALEDLLGPDVFWGALVRTNPEGTDPKSQGDDHIRGVKNVALNTNPRVNAAQSWSAFESNQIIAALNYNADTFNLWAEQAIGEIAAFCTGLPTGWLPCNGTLFDVATYPQLYAVIGDTYTPAPDGIQFRTPQYNGYFLRAQDQGVGRDPDAATRAARPDGTAGDANGTTQASAVIEHAHQLQDNGTDANPGGGTQNAIGGNGVLQTGAVVGPVASESRPINIYVQWGIRSDVQRMALVALGDDPA